MKEEITEKIGRKTARIAVVGLGHVGLSTATIFADAGFHVIGADIKHEIVEAVSSGRSHLMEPRLGELVEKNVRIGKLKATINSRSAMKNADIGMICVQTPLTRDNQPNLTFVQTACEALAQELSIGKLVVIESTVPPGTTKDVIAPILEEGSKLKCGEDFWLAHCPERAAPGNAIQDFVENVRIVGGYDSRSTRIATELFKSVTNGEILTTDCTSSEVAKLAENTFRDVNIAFANELALICEQIGVDVMEVIRLANTHPRVNIHRPGCGVGGPCIPKDPYLLLHSVAEKDFESRLIKPSRELNDRMPEHTVALLTEALEEQGKDPGNSKTAVLGAAFKGEVDNASNSPAKPIIRKLMELGSDVVVYDPYSPESYGAKKAKSVIKAVEGADSIVIVTSHNIFQELELERIRTVMKREPIIVDGRRVIDPTKGRKKGFEYSGIGYNI